MEDSAIIELFFDRSEQVIRELANTARSATACPATSCTAARTRRSA